jgi:phosphohistidine phosphatase SixA
MRNARLASWIVTALVAAGCGGTAPKAETAPNQIVVYVVRHAEKLVSPDAPKDPPLTELGSLRAAALARAIDAPALVAVYATPFARTKGTAAPAAEAAGLPISEYAPDDTIGLVAKIRSAGSGRVLVVGHSNTVPEIVKALGVMDPIALGDGDYGDLFVVTLSPDGTATLERKRFGD